MRIAGPDGGRGGIGWVTAIVRWIGTYLSALPLYCGYIAVAMDPERQGWHDKLARTHVVTRRRDLGTGALAAALFSPPALVIVGYMLLNW